MDAEGNVIRKIEIIIERDKDGVSREIKFKGVPDLEVGEGLEIDDTFEGNESDLGAITSDGKRHKIKIMPDVASEIILDRLNTLNFTKIELKEVRHKNIPRVVYNIETNQHGRFLGVFKLAMKVESQIDSETGEFIGISKPWWAFLVTGEDKPDESLLEGRIKIRAETLNGSSEIKVEIRFGTYATEKDVVVEELLGRLNLSAEEVDALLKIEESEEALDLSEELEVEIEVEKDITEVEFEFEFGTNSDVREEIVNVIVTKLSEITLEDINNVLEFEVEDEDEEDDSEDEEEEETEEEEENETEENNETG